MKRRKFILTTTGIAGAVILPQASATQPCPPPLVSVVGGSTAATTCAGPGSVTALAALASSMARGTWAQMSPAPQGLNLFTAAGGLFSGGASNLAIAYTSGFARDPNNKKFYFVGSDHFGIPNPSNAHGVFLSYDEATNAWSFVSYIPWGVSPGGGATPAHGYENTSYDTVRNKVWHKPPYGKSIRRFDGGSSWSSYSLSPASYGSAIGASVYFPELDKIVYHSVESAPNGILVGLNPATGVGTTLASGSSLSGAGDYSDFMRYSAARQLIYFGGGNGGNSVWTYSAAGVLTRKDNLPAALSGMGPGGNGSKHAFVNPANGNLIGIARASVWYELNPAAALGSQWTVKSGPVSVLSANTVDGSAYGVTACEVPEYGVVVFLKNYSGGSPAEMWLFKA